MDTEEEKSKIRGYWQCPKCGKFCGKVEVFENGLEEVVEITGICKTHGKVDLTDSEWESY